MFASRRSRRSRRRRLGFDKKPCAKVSWKFRAILFTYHEELGIIGSNKRIWKKHNMNCLKQYGVTEEMHKTLLHFSSPKNQEIFEKVLTLLLERAYYTGAVDTLKKVKVGLMDKSNSLPDCSPKVQIPYSEL